MVGDGIITVSNGNSSVVSGANVGIAISQATASSSGYLSQTNWNTFNSKLSNVTKNAPLTGDGTSGNPLGITKATGTTD
jgi:hypothetical protein